MNYDLSNYLPRFSQCDVLCRFPTGWSHTLQKVNDTNHKSPVLLTSLNTTVLFMNVSVSSKTSELDMGPTKRSG